MNRKTIRLEQAEQGMKLASAVVTVAGQRLLTAGTILDDAMLALLKKHGMRYIQVFAESYDREVDAGVFSEAIKNLSARGDQTSSAAVVDAPEPAGPSELPAAPSDRPEEEKLAEVKARVETLREHLAEEKKQRLEKFGDRYSTVSYSLGDPKPFKPDAAYAPYVDLLGLLARDMTDKLLFERRIDADLIQTLVKDVVGELANRGSVMQLLTAAYSVSRYLLSHMVNVGLFSMRVAAEMKLSAAEVTDVAIGAILHDIGMVIVPVGFWSTRRELTSRAKSELQKHPELGAQLIRETPNTREVWSLPALEHHERLDGGGYPAGKQGKDLSLASRIVQICDVYEAMTSERTYRYANYPDLSMKHILGSPDQFDRDIAQVFCKCLGFYPEGYQVKLSTGESALVLSSNPKNVFRPVVRIVADPDGTKVPAEPESVLDLTNRLDLRIVEISKHQAPA